MADIEPAIIAENLTKAYGRLTALDGIDLVVEGAGVTAILGANGAGKSTFINCALGLVRPSKGRVRVLGAKAGSMKVRRRTGVMLQDADLPDQLSPREHIELFASYYPDPLRVDEVLELCDLNAFARKAYSKLSGGQKRRVQFALALTGQPDLVFLDEPTTGLDTDARRGLWKIVRNLNDIGKSVILTTHYLEEADTLADRIIVMNSGQIIADGPTDNIRDAVSGALIRCVTKLSLQVLHDLPAVKSAKESGRFSEILTKDQTKTLKALLIADPAISDLTVTRPSLEEAFLDLTQNGQEAE